MLAECDLTYYLNHFGVAMIVAPVVAVVLTLGHKAYKGKPLGPPPPDWGDVIMEAYAAAAIEAVFVCTALCTMIH